MNILSLFDGISCARVAIDRLGIKVDKYYASEIDKYAIQIALKNYPDTIEVGDISKLKGNDFKDIDLLIGGSPCQDLSIAGKRKGLEGERSGLFWEYVRLLKEIKPRYFILENVYSMPKEVKQIITETLGVEPIMINASLVSAQNRKRLFWTNIQNINQPEDKGILLKDILEYGDVERLKSYCIDANYFKGGKIGGTHQSSTRNYTIRIGDIGGNAQAQRIYSPEGKSVALSANGGGQGAKTGLYLIIPEATKKGFAIATEGQSVDLSFPNSKTRRGRVGDKVKNLMTSQSIGVVQNSIIRKLTPIECERLMTLPDNYTESISNTQRYKCLGNGFVVDVIAHILKNINGNNG